METNPKLPPFEIIPATWRDLSELRHLERVCFPKDAWPLLDLIAVLSFPNVIRLKAVVDDKMVGFIAGDLRSSKKMAWIATIGVLPEFRRQGIAAALLNECETRLDVARIRLSVRLGNAGAIRLYETFGYQRVDIWPKYYQDGTDALVFQKLCQI
jgi:ribosomal-protein-alanine N-acetyltransferase